jgi:TRAP transporter TAXI family solute receptor
MRKLIIAAAVTALAFAGTAVAQQKLSIGTGGTGGVYYPLGGGLANILSKNLPNTQATAEVTGGSVDNLKLLGAKQSEIGFTMVDAGFDAMKGQDKFKDKIEIRTLAVLYPNRMHVVTIEGTGINKMSDLKGKRVSTGSPGSATEVMAFRVIEAAGLDKDKDMTRERLGAAESVNAIKDKKIDAFFWVGGIPTAAVTDLAATPGVKIKMIDHADVVDAMNKKYGPLYSKATIAQTAYPGMDKPAQIADVWNVLVVRADMDEKLAYAVVKTMFDKQADLIAVHKEAESLKLATQSNDNTPIPFHPGAIKFYAEKGVTVK